MSRVCEACSVNTIAQNSHTPCCVRLVLQHSCIVLPSLRSGKAWQGLQAEEPQKFGCGTRKVHEVRKREEKRDLFPFVWEVFSATHVCSEISRSTPMSWTGVLPYPGCLFWPLEEVLTEESARVDIIFEAAGLDRNSEGELGSWFPTLLGTCILEALGKVRSQRAAEGQLKLCFPAIFLPSSVLPLCQTLGKCVF